MDHKFKFHSKKGQLPFIELNGQQTGDSTTIIRELSSKFEKDIDAGLTKEQKNISHAMISMVENHLTFVILSWRAKNPGEMINGYKINFQQSLGSKIPNGILSFFFKLNYGHRVSICQGFQLNLFNLIEFILVGIKNRQSSGHWSPQTWRNCRIGQRRFEYTLGASRWQAILLRRRAITGMINSSVI